MKAKPELTKPEAITVWHQAWREAKPGSRDERVAHQALEALDVDLTEDDYAEKKARTRP